MNRTCLLAILLALAVRPVAASASTWIEHASIPGPELASIGLSRFDQLFLQADHGYHIPYPYAALVDFLEARLDNGDHDGVRQVLIPMGRSLQRDAPRPDYFRLPRAVLALEGEPVTRGDEAGQVLEYRLFIAHQPATETLEVISYNDALGRFEFQVVENYSAGGPPRVRPARRAMCLSCHQNGGPIFPRMPWSETSFNVAVAKRLRAEMPEHRRSLIGLITNDAGVIDVLAERANYLSAAQLIWRDACVTPACRAAMLRAVLQYRLSGKASFDTADPSYRRDYVAEISRNWQQRWPDGIALASSRIPDRDPFDLETLPVHLDALAPRPAHASWQQVDAILADGIIYRLAGFFTRADIQRIDRHLIAQSTRRQFPRRLYHADCRLHARAESTYILHCDAAAGDAGLRAELELELEQRRLRAVRLLSLQVPGDMNIWQPRSAKLQIGDGRADLELAAANADLSQRLADGARIRRLSLDWQGLFDPRTLGLELEIVDEFVPVEEALAAMLDNHRGVDGQSLDAGPFQRESVLGEMMQAMSMPGLNWSGTRVVAVAPSQPAPADLDGDLLLLRPYCGHCHDRAGPFPPGFLSAPDARARIVRCAPRMLVRLRAWRDYPDGSTIPMPPPASLPSSGITAEAWPDSEHYRKLVAALDEVVRQDHATAATTGLPAANHTAPPRCGGD